MSTDLAKQQSCAGETNAAHRTLLSDSRPPSYSRVGMAQACVWDHYAGPPGTKDPVIDPRLEKEAKQEPRRLPHRNTTSAMVHRNKRKARSQAVPRASRNNEHNFKKRTATSAWGASDRFAMVRAVVAGSEAATHSVWQLGQLVLRVVLHVLLQLVAFVGFASLGAHGKGVRTVHTVVPTFAMWCHVAVCCCEWCCVKSSSSPALSTQQQLPCHTLLSYAPWCVPSLFTPLCLAYA